MQEIILKLNSKWYYNALLSFILMALFLQVLNYDFEEGLQPVSWKSYAFVFVFSFGYSYYKFYKKNKSNS